MIRNTIVGCKLDMDIILRLIEQVSDEGYSNHHASHIVDTKGNAKNGKHKWNFLMACLNRVKHIAFYLNSDEMKINFNHEFANFKFTELLNYASQIDNITLELIRNLPQQEIRSNRPNQFFILEDFKRKYQKDNYEDSRFIDYIRSLCAIHPTNTDRHSGRGFQSGLEFSPHVQPAGVISTFMKFPLLINTSTEEGRSCCMDITVYPGAKMSVDVKKVIQESEQLNYKQEDNNIGSYQTLDIEEAFEQGDIDQEEFEIMKDQACFGNDYHIIVNAKDIIRFIEDRYSRLRDLLY
ncbi:hypothetical protein US8_01495 [Bacillus altitudinis]|uniref:hypothetical protein n=1 Tax=Bacillus altitudinis TaxID=293387 RepID=UPI000D7CC16B|nr:hypothetical protein [Bacillus altitudinis]PYH23810.1 hypothetical protein US8_01495 [Bacillus altitudinis]